MHARIPTLAIITLMVLSCSDKKNGGDATDDPVTDEAEAEADVEEEDAGPVLVEPIVPEAGTLTTSALDCTGSYTYPDELTSDEGLGHHGWDWDDTRFSLAWAVDNQFTNDWISRNDDTSPSLRIRPWLVPEAGTCYQQQIATSTSAAGPHLARVLGDMTAFSHPEHAYDALASDEYASPAYDLEVDDVLVRAIRGLHDMLNALDGAPAVDPWDMALQDEIAAAVVDYPDAMQQAIAGLVLSIGEAYALKQAAISEVDMSAMRRIHQQFFDEYYPTIQTTFASPAGGTIVDDLIANADWIDMSEMYGAGLAVTRAADACLEALAAVAPFDSPGLNVLTPHGRIIVSTADEDTTYTAEELADATLVIDLAGNDTYGGRYAATHAFWMSGSVLVDVEGDDLYTPETADIEDSATTRWEAFDVVNGITQGCGLVGVGVLVDGAGQDAYEATVYAQGSGALGVGVLHDHDGTDTYKLGNAGQGAGYFGIGLLLESAGDDRYGVYTTGQGSGKPGGHGALIDVSGTDTYIGYYQEMEPELPAPGYNNYFNLTGSWSYRERDTDIPHFMSNCQGIGWGYRGDWMTPERNWMGGFGALIDLGTGNDEHYADCMSMGQGFVYGFGFLYDGGGDDRYRTFWWGPAASAHMGVSLFVDEDGNDDILVTRASGGFGYDCSVGWLIDNGGNDTYGGQFHYGKGYTYGLTFFINTGGDDTYNSGTVLTDPPFGIVQGGHLSSNLIGVFMDLGSGTDTYNSAYAGVGNDALWYLDPIGSDVDPARHKGVGIDK